ncbi:MAG: PilZ domain-containing protein [Candidatus Scalindua sp.]
MQVKEKDSDKRNNERIDLSFLISLPDQNGTTKNISASGVYFEVITNDIEAFAPGTIIQIQITAITTTPGFEERKIRLKGEGCIVRNNIEDVTTHGNRLGVALEFKDKLNIISDIL